ncbi:MAG: hypothetical protein COA65_09705 [Rhodospirillaceae bacterium]|nr:MAG: hypothetical protein COA65_09705 [Rhodospirillaceae bacterium]
MENKIIWDYFGVDIEFPQEIAHNTLPYGTVWCYIASTFLDGFINHVKPISCYVLDRYTPGDQIIDDKEVRVWDKNKAGEMHKWKGTKKGLIDALISGEKETCHTDLDCFDDDVVILAEIETKKKDSFGRYMFFWFDCDVSDCRIGKFETSDSKGMVVKSVVNWLEGCKKENKNKIMLSDHDNGIVNYTEFPVSRLDGHLSF